MTSKTAIVFPARAGMSPGRGLAWFLAQCFPRTRGDEPRRAIFNLTEMIVFPARAGMSRW